MAGVVVILIAFACWINAKSSEAFGTFGFDVHHRYSNTVKDFLKVDGLPAKGTLDYYAAMAHRDQLFKARRLAATSAATAPASSTSPLTFFGGNETFRIGSLGFLHYAIVNVGTPRLQFLVALDTGSDLFWVPCDCTSCVRSLRLSSGKSLKLNIYSPSASSTSTLVSCNSTQCGQNRGCSVRLNACAYQDVYLSSNTTTTGILVDDILYLGTDGDTSNQTIVEAPITLGCGIVQTGDFLDGAGVNGLFGLGMSNVSVPSILASKGIAANSFSMCFGPDGLGRIEFGDKGSPDQKETPITLHQLQPTYNITVTQIAVESNVTDLEFTAIFDSGTSFTYVNDPAYTAITKSFDSYVNDPRYNPNPEIIFDYCYSLSANQNSYLVPNLNLTMKGGNQLFITEPTVVIPRQDGGFAYCLAVVKSEDINIIGQNFMTGYRIVFDREDMVLRWKESDCYDSISSKNGSTTLPLNGSSPSEAPSPSALKPEAAATNKSHSPVSSPTASPPLRSAQAGNNNNAAQLNSMANGLLMAIFSIVFHHLIIISS